MASPLFVIAPEGDAKLVNLALMYLRDWQYAPEPEVNGDDLRLITSRELEQGASRPQRYSLRPRGQRSAMGHGTQAPPLIPLESTRPPIPHYTVNEWKGASLSEVEEFCLALDRTGVSPQELDHHLFLVLDEQGARDQTVVLLDRVMEWPMPTPEQVAANTELKATYLERFNKLRIPWFRANVELVNLRIANVSFEEVADEQQGPDADGWWRYAAETVDTETYLESDNERKRNRAIEKMKKQGHL